MTKSTKSKKKPIRDLSNATPSFLVDELGSIKDRIKELQTEEGVLKQALLAKLSDGQRVIQGETHSGMISDRTRVGLDSAKVLEDMGEEWVEDHSKTTEYTELRVTAN